MFESEDYFDFIVTLILIYLVCTHMIEGLKTRFKCSEKPTTEGQEPTACDC